MKDKKSFYGSWLLFLAVLFAGGVILTVLAKRFDYRADLTGEGLHSISKHTAHILERLDDRVTVQFWVSSKLPPGLHNLRRDVLDFLREFERSAPDKIEIEVRDPDAWIDEAVRVEEEEKKRKEAAGEKVEEEKPPFNPFDPFGGQDLPPREKKKREFAQKFQIRELEGRSLEQDKFEIINFYSGFRLTYKDRQPEVLPALASLDSLEYELASRIVKLTVEEKPHVAFFLGRLDDLVDQPPDPRMPGMPPQKTHPYKPFLDQVLAPLFAVEEITLEEDSPIPESTDVLIVAEPDGLDDRQLYEIDRYIARGGHAILLVGHFSGDLDRRAMIQLDPNIERLFETWGIDLDPRVPSSYDCGVVEVVQQTSIGLPIRRTDPVPLLPAASGTSLDRETPLTRGLSRLVFPFASPLTWDPAKIEANGLHLTVLGRSGDESWLTNWAGRITEAMLRPRGSADGEPQYSTYDLAYFIEGTFPSTFKPGEPLPRWPSKDAGGDDDDDDDAEGAEKAEEDAVIPPLEGAPGSVVVLGSGDLAKVQYLVSNQQNIQFLQSAVESFALGEDLVKIRAKNQEARLLRDSEEWERGLTKYGNAFGVPLLVALFGIVRWLVRRTAARAYEDHYIAQQRGEQAA